MNMLMLQRVNSLLEMIGAAVERWDKVQATAAAAAAAAAGE